MQVFFYMSKLGIGILTVTDEAHIFIYVLCTLYMVFISTNNAEYIYIYIF